MELDQLRNFLRVAERRNFTRAAEELLLSQPALSRSIQRLEEELGQPVFERQSRSIELTDAGRLLESRARQILAIVDDTKAEIGDDGQSGRVRIGAIPTIAPYLLPELLRPFANTHTKAQLLVSEETTDRLLHRVRQGEVDLALLALPIPDRYLEAIPLFEEELWVVLPDSHPLAQRREVGTEELHSEPFVLLEEAHCLSDQIVTFCRSRAFQPVSVERTSQIATVQELVALGHGVSLVPEMARRVDRGEGRVYRGFVSPKPMRTVALVRNPHRFESRLVAAFRQHVIETYEGEPVSAKGQHRGR